MIDAKKLSGLEYLKTFSESEELTTTISKIIPMKKRVLESGYVLFEAKADERHLNPLGGVHGGFASTVLDSVTGCAVHTMLEPGEFFATVDLHVQMIRPVPLNVMLEAEGRLVNISKSIGFSHGTLKTENGKLLAQAYATCIVKRELKH